jgi:hypothetical protein
VPPTFPGERHTFPPFPEARGFHASIPDLCIGGAAVASRVGASAAPHVAQELKIAVAADVRPSTRTFFNLFPNNNIAEHIFDKLVQMDPDSR